MKVRITSHYDKGKVFDMMKHVTDKYPLERETKVKLNDDGSISLYLVVSDETKEEIERSKIPWSSKEDEEIPF